MALFSAGSSPTYHLAPFVLYAITTLQTFSCGVPQCSVLGPVLSSCTYKLTPLSLSILLFPFPN